ncbi:tetratricopeptide (TPR) repeat protein [Chitinophaga terrae (ex Kim and Jung 2007)]|uniref:RagB/SusD family nutrient uptake outer membrane protein n=1 Tax=Chitinophaga terrae (ex Kim and Jung 2007) TaxID=408074 RepID=UPI002780B0D6|nr:RagB/SusD family nutrient uptake outer membrane protein [Chitinophaga terrae (ex Kim and Jung 2007)]MDQ0105576.1 tetratricopeptide (TPR) repeat protein [Chitinophaga terrae (ex Kim and Jung 2007)]
MKYAFKYISCLALGAILITTASCNKKLELAPKQDIVPTEIKTEDDVITTLLGGYKSLQEYDAFGERFLFVADLMANTNTRFSGTFVNYREVYARSIQENNTIASGMWGNAYEAINGMNLVLSRLDLVSADNKAVVEAEAKFIRGVFYFELAGFYGQPYSAGNITTNLTAPIINQPFLTAADLQASKQPRATVDAMYKQVLADLQAAAAALPESYNEKKDKPRATKYAAEAFLSRVYMAMGDYPKAAAAANTVIESGAYSLMPSFSTEFNNSTLTVEDIFAIVQSSQSNAGTSNNGLTTFYSFDARSNVRVDPTFLDQFEDSDTRKSFFNVASATKITTYKWNDYYGTIPVIRLAEMYLTRAEANFRAGTAIGDTPLNDVNLIRTRSKATPLTTVTADAIVAERHRELSFEGDDYWTNKRLKLNLGSKPYNDNKVIFPIPLREINVNPSLIQNPGYKSN